MKEKNSLVKVLILITIATYIIIIFIFSNQTGLHSNSISKAIVNGMGKYITIPADILKISDSNLVFRKITHFFEYFILTILFFIALKYYKFNTKKGLVFALILCILFAVIDETHQSFIPGRTPRVFDVVVDTLGGTFGIIFKILWNILKNRNKQIII